VARNIEGIYAKGLSLENITGLDQYFDSIKEGLPQIAGIRIAPSEFNSQVPADRVQVTVADDYVQCQIFRVLLDMLTVFIISVFFMTELTLLAVSAMMPRGPTRAPDESLDTNAEAGHGAVRTLIFFVNLCACMSITFVPIVMQNLYKPVPGLTKDVVLGLPLSAEMLGGILAIFLVGWLINKQSWRPIFYMGILLLAAGNILAGLSTSGLLLVIARGIAGLGLGHILMAIRSLVVSLPRPNVAIAEFSAGSIAGLNCGLVVGGILADRIGYAAVFYLAAALVIIPVILVRRFMTELEIRERVGGKDPGGAKFMQLIKDKKTLLFLTCIFIPYFITGAFLDYYFPLFASAQGLSQSDISRGFLLNGLFIIYLGPVLTGYATKKLGSVKGIILSMAIVICALLAFIAFGTVPAALLTIALLGIAESFGVSLKTTYFLNLPGIRDLPINKGIAYFSGMVNASRMAGPMIYGLALSLGMRMGMGIIALGLSVLLVFFIFYGRLEPVYGNCD
jgi:predicted MFS family arabinose efflux permease